MVHRASRKTQQQSEATIRRLEARVHELEQAQLPLRSEIQGLTGERDRMASKVIVFERQNHILRDAVDALVRLVAEFASGKRAG